MADPAVTERFSLAGRRVLVTGASSGLGAHFARVSAAAGAGVVLAARRVDKLQALAQELSAGGASVVTHPLDVTDEASVEATVAAAAPFDVLVNNAGIAEGGAAISAPTRVFDDTIATNLRGAWMMAVNSARAMRERGPPERGADIVNIASILALRVGAGLGAYAVSKAGVAQMTRAHAAEWARYNIRVNALAPGYVETDINSDFFATEAGKAMMKRIPQRRLGRLEDLDAPFLLLASGASPYLTGAVLPVDGGHSINPL
jgi:NAD(P)-dependent dehydrogenase (short-subunit alcohol dehydrogenase family)